MLYFYPSQRSFRCCGLMVEACDRASQNFTSTHSKWSPFIPGHPMPPQEVAADEFCVPLKQITVDGQTLDLNPCGLIANSMFNGEDRFSVLLFTRRGVASPAVPSALSKKPRGSARSLVNSSRALVSLTRTDHRVPHFPRFFLPCPPRSTNHMLLRAVWRRL